MASNAWTAPNHSTVVQMVDINHTLTARAGLWVVIVHIRVLQRLIIPS